jgi:predicted glutamine amidotransferase
MGGTGIGIVHREYDTDFAKSHLSAPAFLCSEEWEWAARQLDSSRAILGHTRSATMGNVKSKNSHPFSFADDKGENGILMIHNGHVKNWVELSPNTFHHEVDSAHVAYSLYTRGGLETLKMLEGAYTLVWYDQRTKTLNMARNEERELYYAQNTEKTTLWFASELDMLASLLRRNGIAHKSREFFELPKLTLCSYDLTKKKLEPVLTEYEEKKFQPVFPNGNGGHSEASNGKHKDYTRFYSVPGDYIWVNVKSAVEHALTLYKPVGDGENQVPEKSAFGYVYGTRSMDFGSIVRINGIGLREWEDTIKYIKECIPVKITRVERAVTNEGNTGTHNFYECILDREEVEIEFKRVAVAVSLKKRREKEQQDKLKATESAGRNLPVPQTNEAVERVGVGEDGGQIPKHGVLGPVDEPGRIRTPMGLEEGEPVPPSRVPGPRGTKIPIEVWRQIADDGCYFCEGVIIEKDVGEVEWWEHPRNVEDRSPVDAEYQMICVCCKGDPKHIEALVG